MLWAASKINPSKERQLKQQAHVGDEARRDASKRHRLGPTTSIVVAWRASTNELETLLTTLAPRCHDDGTELIVVRSAGGTQRRRFQRVYPTARLISAPADLSVAKLRELGAAEATGDILVILDDEITIEQRSHHLHGTAVHLRPDATSLSDGVDLQGWLRHYGIAEDGAARTSLSESLDAAPRFWTKLLDVVAEYVRFRRWPIARQGVARSGS